MRDAAWRLFRLTGRALRGRDLSLHAAAVTFYGGIAVAPVALLIRALRSGRSDGSAASVPR
jgi:uncharacterized BrkB/YihY/UPF0761 family membrane protein